MQLLRLARPCNWVHAQFAPIQQFDDARNITATEPDVSEHSVVETVERLHHPMALPALNRSGHPTAQKALPSGGLEIFCMSEGRRIAHFLGEIVGHVILRFLQLPMM